jgi:hypothetical protein
MMKKTTYCLFYNFDETVSKRKLLLLKNYIIGFVGAVALETVI